MSDADTLFARGAQARQEGRNDLARTLFLDALAREPTHRNAALALAFLFREEGEGGKAAEALRPLVRAPVSRPQELAAIAEFVAETGETDLALEALERARAESGEAPALLFAHGRLLFQTGRFDEAREAFRRAFARDPHHGGAYYQWVQTRRWTGREGDEALEVLTRATAGPSSPETLSAISFARAKVADDLGRTGEAFANLHAANALRKSTLPPFDHAFYEEWLETFLPGSGGHEGALPAPAATDAPRAGDPLPEPVFVVGLPRSGTTLLARLLLRRGDAALAGELDLLGRLAGHLTGPHGRPRDLRRALETLPSSEREGLAEAYLHELRARIGGRRPRWVLDKNPLNVWFLPLLRTLFPRAPVFWCRRDRRDVLLSLYFQNFAHPALDFSYDLADLERHLLLAARAEEAILAGRDPHLLPLDYETFVRDPLAALRPSEKILGPAPHPNGKEKAALENEGRITTASAWQARQPLHTGSVGRWHRYARFLVDAHPALRHHGFTIDPDDPSGT